MKLTVAIIVAGIILFGILLFYHRIVKEPEKTHLSISNPAFAYNAQIPSKYTCDPENIKPPLLYHNVPAGAKSLALFLDDPDIPQSVKDSMHISVFDHWVVFNIPPSVTSIPEGAQPEGTPGVGTRGDTKYLGPCPPDREHRYFFKLYALDAMLNLPKGATKDAVSAAMEGHIIEHSELVGRYERK